MNQEQPQNISFIKALNYFLVFYIIYALIGFGIFHFAAQEASQAIAKAPENKKLEVLSSRMRMYSYFM